MPYPFHWSTTFLVLLALCGATARAADPNDHFEAKVRPVLVQHCIKCHGPEKQKGGLRLDTKPGWQTGGESGPAIKPGKPDESLLIKAVRGTDEKFQMPPNGKLTAQEVAALVQWVKDGAVDPRDGGPVRLGGVTIAEAKKWWSFQPVDAVAPVPKNAATNPIDAFVLAKLEAKGLTPSPPADKRTLIRRATFDLTGLPPTAEEVEAFLADASPDAFAKVVDRLLASPAYGERWGRHWLDVVRYADTAGENSRLPGPAGVPLPQLRHRRVQPRQALRPVPARADRRRPARRTRRRAEEYAARVIATGYLAIARRFGHDIDKDHAPHHRGHASTTSARAFLGLTHRLRPLPRPQVRPDHGEGLLRPVRHLRQHAVRLPRLRAEAATARPRAARATCSGIVREAYRTRRARGWHSGRRSGRPNKHDSRRRKRQLDEAAAGRERGLRRRVAEASRRACTCAATPRSSATSCRGASSKCSAASRSPAKAGSGRLRAGRLARRPDEPADRPRDGQPHLAAPLRQGARRDAERLRPPRPAADAPRAARLARRASSSTSGWSIKAMHRLIMLSRDLPAGQRRRRRGGAGRSGQRPALALRPPPADAEEIRDALLAVGGELDRTPGGPHPFPPRSDVALHAARPVQRRLRHRPAAAST